MSSEIPGYSHKGYVTGFDLRHNFVQVLVQVSEDMKADLKIRLSASKDVRLDILTGLQMRDGWDGTLINKTSGWEKVDLGEIQLTKGNNLIRINSHTPKADLKIDYFEIDPMATK